MASRPTLPLQPRAVVGYVRVSTEKQGLSLEAQQARIEAMALGRGVGVQSMIVDTESAKTLERPGMVRLLAMIEARAVDTVIVAKLDRLTRSVRDLADLLERFEAKGVALISVSESLDTSSPAGRLVLNIMMSVSQWEREAIGERTRDALRQLKAQGKSTGTPVYGFQRGADGLVPHVGEQAMLSVVRDCRAAGFSLKATAEALNEAGYTTRAGTPWRMEYVRSLLKTAA